MGSPSFENIPQQQKVQEQPSRRKWSEHQQWRRNENIEVFGVKIPFKEEYFAGMGFVFIFLLIAIVRVPRIRYLIGKLLSQTSRNRRSKDVE